MHKNSSIASFFFILHQFLNSLETFDNFAINLSFGFHNLLARYLHFISLQYQRPFNSTFKMKTQTFTSAMTMMVTIITSVFERASAAPVSSPAPAPAPVPAAAPAPAPIIGNLPPIADINIEARDASADAAAEATPDVGDWIHRARRAE